MRDPGNEVEANGFWVCHVFFAGEKIARLARNAHVCVAGLRKVLISNARGPVSRKRRKHFGPVKRFLVHLHLKRRSVYA